MRRRIQDGADVDERHQHDQHERDGQRKIQTDLVRKTIRARTGIDRAEPASAVPTGPAPTSGAVGSSGLGATASVSVGFGGHGLLLVP